MSTIYATAEEAAKAAVALSVSENPVVSKEALIALQNLPVSEKEADLILAVLKESGQDLNPWDKFGFLKNVEDMSLADEWANSDAAFWKVALLSYSARPRSKSCHYIEILAEKMKEYQFCYVHGLGSYDDFLRMFFECGKELYNLDAETKERWAKSDSHCLNAAALGSLCLSEFQEGKPLTNGEHDLPLLNEVKASQPGLYPLLTSVFEAALGCLRPLDSKGISIARSWLHSEVPMIAYQGLRSFMNTRLSMKDSAAIMEEINYIITKLPNWERKSPFPRFHFIEKRSVYSFICEYSANHAPDKNDPDRFYVEDSQIEEWLESGLQADDGDKIAVAICACCMRRIPDSIADLIADAMYTCRYAGTIIRDIPSLYKYKLQFPLSFWEKVIEKPPLKEWNCLLNIANYRPTSLAAPLSFDEIREVMSQQKPNTKLRNFALDSLKFRFECGETVPDDIIESEAMSKTKKARQLAEKFSDFENNAVNILSHCINHNQKAPYGIIQWAINSSSEEVRNLGIRALKPYSVPVEILDMVWDKNTSDETLEAIMVACQDFPKKVAP